MKKLIIVLLLSPLLSVSQSGDKNFIDQNYIEVIGKSEMEVTPDLIYIKILINEKDNKNKTPLAETEKAMIEKLKEIGIDISKDLLIKDLASNYKYYLLAKTDILLSKEYQLVVHDGKTAGRVVVELESLGISNVSIDRLDNSEIVKFRREVKIDAIKAAKDKAQALTEAIGQSIGKAIYIQEMGNRYNINTNSNSNSIRIRGVSSQIYGSRVPEPDIDFEKIKLEYSVLCRFVLE